MEDEKNNVEISEVKRVGDDFINKLAGAFLGLTCKEKKYCIQKKKVRGDQVKNNAGGWVFQVTDEMRIRRFLILGTMSPTYYTKAQTLTMENLNDLIEIINKGKADIILKELYEISLSGRNPKQEPIMMTLALLARYRVTDTFQYQGKEDDDVHRYMVYIRAMHKAAFSIVNQICRIPTHLFMFVKYCEEVARFTSPEGKEKSTGWGRMMRVCISNWYAAKTPDELAMHMTKYPNREGWTHRDLFRLAHPKSQKNIHCEEHLLEVEQLYNYAAKGSLGKRKLDLTDEEKQIEQPEVKYTKLQMENEKKSSALNLVMVFKYLNRYTKEEDISYAIRNYKLVREHIPTEHLNSSIVWRALLCNMPMTAMIRNLGKITSVGALDKYYEKVVTERLTDEEHLKRSRIHPLAILLAKTVYQSGHGVKGSNGWLPNPRVDQALETAFYLSFFNAPPTGKRFLFAFDISGSMSSRIAGTFLSCRTAAAALSLVTLKNEENAKCVGFSHQLIELPYDGSWTIDKIEHHMCSLPFGATDCAQPMIWAKRKKLQFDVFVVYTDNETFYGKVHPFKALQDYRKMVGVHDAKLIVMGMTATKFSIADNTDPFMMDIVGLDSAVPQMIYDFVMGKL